MSDRHLNDDELVAIVDDTLPQAEQKRTDQHVDDCEECAGRLSALFALLEEAAVARSEELRRARQPGRVAKARSFVLRAFDKALAVLQGSDSPVWISRPALEVLGDPAEKPTPAIQAPAAEALGKAGLRLSSSTSTAVRALSVAINTLSEAGLLLSSSPEARGELGTWSVVSQRGLHYLVGTLPARTTAQVTIDGVTSALVDGERLLGPELPEEITITVWLPE